MWLFSKNKEPDTPSWYLRVYMASGKSFKGHLDSKVKCIKRAEGYRLDGFWAQFVDESSTFYPPYQIQRIELLRAPK